MAYQSIFNGGGAKTPTKTNPLAEDFTPGKFAKVNADIAARQPKVAPQAPHITAVGPTSKWARLAQIGVGAVQKAKITAENVGKNVTSDFVNIGKEANRNVIQPIVNPQKGPGAATIMQAQAKAQAAAKSGRVSPEAIKALGQIQSPYDKLTAYQVVGDKTLNKQQMLAKLNPVIQKQSAQTKKALGAALELSSLAVGGGSLKTVTTGGKLLKAGVTNATAGATGGVGSTLVTNPNANKKQLAKAAGIGAATGVVATVGGKVAGKAGETVKTVLGKDKAVNTTLNTAKQNVLLQTGKKANANEEASKAALKSTPIKIPVKEAITDEAKLLPAGERVTQGKGFTMAEKVNPNSISKQKEITQLQDRITKFQQGKLKITPEQAKADAQRLSDLKTGKVQPTAAEKLKGFKMPPLPGEKGYPSMAAEAAPPTEGASISKSVTKPTGAPKVETPLVNTNKAPAKGVGKIINKVAGKTKAEGIFNPEQGLNRAGHTAAAQVVREISAKQEMAGYKGQVALEKAKQLGLDKQSYEKVAANIESGNIKDAAHQHFVSTLQDTGKRGVQAGTLEAARGTEYAPRYAKFTDKSGGTAVGGLRKTGGFSKARVQDGEFGLGGDKYKTYAEFKQAVEKSGGQVANAKASEVLGHSVTSREKAIANAEGLSKLEKTAMADGKPGVVTFSPSKGLNKKYFGYNTSLLDGRAVHPDLVPAIKSLMTDSNAFKGIGKVNSFTKRLVTVNGVVHDLNYTRSSLGEQGLLKTATHLAPTDIVTQGLKDPKYAADTERMMQHGVVFSRLGKTNIYDEANNGANSFGRQIDKKLGKVRAGMDKVVFGVGDNLGRSAYLKIEKGLLSKGFSPKEAGQVAADAANRVMFTQRATESSQEMRNVGRVALFAKNFFQSTLQKATAASGISKNNALSKSAQRAGQVQAAKAMARTFTYLFGAAQAINYHATGKFTWDNKDSKISPVFYVDKNTGKEYHLTNWYGQVGELLHITDPKAIINKLSPGIQQISRVVSNQDQLGFSGGGNVRDTSASGVRQWGQVAANSLEHLVTPVGLDTTKINQMFGKGGQPSKVSATNLFGFGTSSTDRSTVEKDIMSKYYATLPAGASKTPPQTSALEAAARNDLAKGNTNSANLQKLKSQINSKAYNAFVKTGGNSDVQRAFDKLPEDQRLQLIEKYTPDQLKGLDLTSVGKSLVDSSARATVQSLQSKGFSTQRIQQDLNKINMSNQQLQQIKAEAKRQARISSAKARRAPKFANPFGR